MFRYNPEVCGDDQGKGQKHGRSESCGKNAGQGPTQPCPVFRSGGWAGLRIDGTVRLCMHGVCAVYLLCVISGDGAGLGLSGNGGSLCSSAVIGIILGIAGA